MKTHPLSYHNDVMTCSVRAVATDCGMLSGPAARLSHDELISIRLTK